MRDTVRGLPVWINQWRMLGRHSARSLSASSAMNSCLPNQKKKRRVIALHGTRISNMAAWRHRRGNWKWLGRIPVPMAYWSSLMNAWFEIHVSQPKILFGGRQIPTLATHAAPSLAKKSPLLVGNSESLLVATWHLGVCD
jgi:hypothetical protein